MSDLGRQPPDDEEDEIDTGKPIAALANLREPTSRGFFRGIRGRIERRKLGTQVVELGWHGPILVLVEWINALIRGFGGDDESQRRDEEDRRDR